jgi:hypothetical protein
MRRVLVLTLAILACALSLKAVEPCRKIHGRAHYYFADGQFRLWYIGTHHEFSLIYSDYADRDYPTDEKILDMLRAGITQPIGISDNDLFADFLVCPTERYRKGATQQAYVKAMYHPHIVHSHRD